MQSPLRRVRPDQDYFLLRAEWLRFKSHLFDPGTDLPTLAAVLDDVRRLLETRGALGLVYLDLAGNARIEALHGWQAYDELLAAFAKSLRALPRDLIGPRDVVAVPSVRSDKFLVFLEGDSVRPLDASSLEATAERLRTTLLSAMPAQAPRFPPTSLYLGRCLIYRDPMLRTERSIHRALDAAVRESLRQRSREEGDSAQELDGIIQAQRIDVVFQPIVNLEDGTLLGHEVFVRGPAGGSFENPERLFAAAERTGRLLALERLCRQRVFLSLRRHLPPGAKLFLNTSARTLRDPEIAGADFLRQIAAQGLGRTDVVLEITERVALRDRDSCSDALRRLKREGIGIAVDDMGAGYSSLQAIVALEPDYLKFDVSLVRNIDRSQIKRSLLETLVDLARRIGARIIAEGIEAESEMATLREMGVHFGQGRHLAPPRAVLERSSL